MYNEPTYSAASTPNSQPLAERSKRITVSKVLLLTGALLLVALLICSAISVYVGFQLTQPVKKPITETPAAYGMTYREQYFISEDGQNTILKGWVLEPQQPAVMTLIMSHGYRGNRLEQNVPFLPLAKEFVEAGYRVILYDFRYTGESEGKMITLGAKEKYDLLGVINWVKMEHPTEPISLYGVSMGAATSLLAAGLSPDVSAVVADSPFSDLKTYLASNLSVWTGLPEIPFTPLTITLIPMFTELDPSESSPLQALDSIYPRPVLFIHGTGDKYIPHSESERMAALHPDQFQLWLTEGVDHIRSYEKRQEEYVTKVIDFLEAAR